MCASAFQKLVWGPVSNLNGYLSLISFIMNRAGEDFLHVFVGGLNLNWDDERKEAASTMTNHRGHHERSLECRNL